MKRERRQLLLIQAVGLEIALVPIENESHGPIPIFNDVQSLMNLSSQFL